MNIRTTFALIVIALILAGGAYAIVLQATGQAAVAERFIEWAGGGLVTIAVIFFIFFLPSDPDD